MLPNANSPQGPALCGSKYKGTDTIWNFLLSSHTFAVPVCISKPAHQAQVPPLPCRWKLNGLTKTIFQQHRSSHPQYWAFCTAFLIALLKEVGLWALPWRAALTHWHHCPTFMQAPPWPESCAQLASWEALEPGSEAPRHFLGTGMTGDTGLPKWPHLLWLSFGAPS